MDSLTRAEFLTLVAGAGLAAQLPVLRGAATTTETITIEETTWEARPGLTFRTQSFGGAVPGQLLRLREGDRVSVKVRNLTREPQAISWHGLPVASTIGGLDMPSVPPGGSRTYRFVAAPAGTRMYHAMLGDGMFTSMFGAVIVDPKVEAGDYDREVVLVLHGFGATVPKQAKMMEEERPRGPTLAQPAMGMDESCERMMRDMNMKCWTQADMLMRDIEYAALAVNGKALGANSPIRVRRGEVVRFRIVNASATLTHRLALPGHRFRVTHLDGNPVVEQWTLDAVELGPGERIDALVRMDAPGIWVLGSTERKARELGLGIVVAYDGAHGQPEWRDEAKDPFRYAAFGRPEKPPPVDDTYQLVLRKSPDAPEGWSINGRRYPQTEPIVVRAGGRYLLRLVNMSMDEHPMHLLGHAFELVSVDGIPTSGIVKDSVVVRPMMGRVELLLRANNTAPGRYALLCHNWQHFKGGMEAELRYAAS